MLGDQPIIVEVYNPQLSKRFAEGEAIHHEPSSTAACGAGLIRHNSSSN